MAAYQHAIVVLDTSAESNRTRIQTMLDIGEGAYFTSWDVGDDYNRAANVARFLAYLAPHVEALIAETGRLAEAETGYDQALGQQRWGHADDFRMEAEQARSRIAAGIGNTVAAMRRNGVLA